MSQGVFSKGVTLSVDLFFPRYRVFGYRIYLGDSSGRKLSSALSEGVPSDISSAAFSGFELDVAAKTFSIFVPPTDIGSATHLLVFSYSVTGWLFHHI